MKEEIIITKLLYRLSKYDMSISIFEDIEEYMYNTLWYDNELIEFDKLKPDTLNDVFNEATFKIAKYINDYTLNAYSEIDKENFKNFILFAFGEHCRYIIRQALGKKPNKINLVEDFLKC